MSEKQLTINQLSVTHLHSKEKLELQTKLDSL